MTPTTFRNKVYHSEVCTRAASQLQNSVASKMYNFAYNHPVISRLSAPLICPAVTVASIGLRVASVAEPIIIGVPGDIVCAIHDRSPRPLARIAVRPWHVARNLFWGIIGSLKDVAYIGSGSLVGVVGPETAYSLIYRRSQKAH